MSREIKFRCWDNEKKTMVLPGTFATIDNGEVYLKMYMDGDLFAQSDSDGGKDGLHEHGLDFEKNRFTLMQFTGLYDRMGQRIFEGDILQWGDPKSDMGVQRGSVIFLEDLAMFSIQLSDGWFHFADDEDRIIQGLEIIGNIYENPELLK